MQQRTGLRWAIAMLTALLTGCSGTSTTASKVPAPAANANTPNAAPTGAAGTVGGPTQLAPLTAAAPNAPFAASAGASSAAGGGGASSGAGSPAAPHFDVSGLTLRDIVVNGDPTRIVYPSANLASGTLYPAIIFAHGHGMDQTQFSDRTALAQAAVKEGWLCAGGAFGGRSAWANDTALHGVGALVTELVTHHQADPKRIYFVGFSMGGGTALLAAENPLSLPYRPAAVVSTQGFTDLKAMTLPEAEGGAYAADIRLAYGGKLDDTTVLNHSPLSLAERLTGIPVYLEHGAADTNVPMSHSVRMADRLTSLGMPPQLHTYPGLTHSEETIHVSAIVDFLRGKSTP
jgi:predicted esterase